MKRKFIASVAALASLQGTRLARSEDLATLLAASNDSTAVRLKRSVVAEKDDQVFLTWDDSYPDFYWQAHYGDSYRGVPSTTSLFKARFPIIEKGKTWNKVRVARAEHRQSQADLLDTRQDTKEDIILGYFRWLLETEKKRSLQTRIDFFGEVLIRAEKLLKVGAAPRLQVWRLRKEMSVMRKEMRLTELSIQDAEVNLRLLVNLPASFRFQSREIKTADIDQRFLGEIRSRRAEIVSAQPSQKVFEEKLSEMGPRRQLAYSDHYPELYGEAGYGSFRHAGPAIAKAQWTAGLTLTVPLPIFDIPLNLRALNRTLAQQESRIRIEKAYDLKKNAQKIDHVLAEIQTATESLSDVKEYMFYLDQELKEDRKNYLLGTLDGVAFIASTQMNITQRLNLKALTNMINQNYLLLKLMTGESQLDY